MEGWLLLLLGQFTHWDTVAEQLSVGCWPAHLPHTTVWLRQNFARWPYLKHLLHRKGFGMYGLTATRKKPTFTLSGRVVELKVKMISGVFTRMFLSRSIRVISLTSIIPSCFISSRMSDSSMSTRSLQWITPLQEFSDLGREATTSKVWNFLAFNNSRVALPEFVLTWRSPLLSLRTWLISSVKNDRHFLSKKGLRSAKRVWSECKNTCLALSGSIFTSSGGVSLVCKGGVEDPILQVGEGDKPLYIQSKRTEKL